MAKSFFRKRLFPFVDIHLNHVYSYSTEIYWWMNILGKRHQILQIISFVAVLTLLKGNINGLTLSFTEVLEPSLNGLF